MISVIISTFNRPEKLKRAIQSVINQSYKDWECIVVHDGEWSKYPLAHPAIEDERIIYKSVPHFGNHSKPKNEGIKLSKGEYICFLDDDNEFRSDHLQVLLNAFKNNPQLDIAYGDRWIIDELLQMEPQLGVSSDFNPYILMQRNFIDTSDFLIKRESMFKLGGWDEEYKRMLDWNLMVRAAKSGMKFQRVPLIITNYYLHETQLSNNTDGLNESGMPVWEVSDCLIELPYLGEVQEPKVAIFTLTYDRLEETKVAFESMYRTAGYPFYHLVVDNGSVDGTIGYLKDLSQSRGKDTDIEFTGLITYQQNQGISKASNAAVDNLLNKHSGYDVDSPRSQPFDIIMKVDNDAVFLSDGWLKRMVELWKRNHIMALSCYVQGLKDNPGGAPRIGYGTIDGEYLGITKHLGGICHFVDASAYKNFRWNEDSFYHGIQDLEFSNYLSANGFSMAYMENYFVNHGVDGTDGQMNRFKDYFERRKSEKTTKPKGVEKDYKQVQIEESAYSRGTIWGDRIKDSIEKYNSYLKGKVLDVGCGDGYGLDLLTKMGFEASGIDISDPKIRLANFNGHDAWQGVIEEMPFKDKQFDTVFCSHTLEHAQDLQKACEEIQRVASRAILIVPIEEHTENPGHTSPIKSKEFLLEHFKDVQILHEEELGRLEREQVLILEWK